MRLLPGKLSAPGVKPPVMALLLASSLTVPMPVVAAQAATDSELTAREKTLSLNLRINAGPLSRALNQLAGMSGAALSYDPALTEGKVTQGIQGAYTLEQALQVLLHETGLRLSKQGRDNYVILAADSADVMMLAPVQVSGSQLRDSATGPVDGYIARRSLTAMKTDTSLAKTPQSVSVVSAQQIQDQGVSSVAEALRYSAGVFAEYRGSSNLHDETFLRGFFYVPKFLNGLAFGTNSLGQLDPYLLERVEVIRGPSSILYGQAKPAGLINMVSKQPTGETARNIRVGAGNNDLLETGVDIAGVVSDELSYRVVGSHMHRDLEEYSLEREGKAILPSFTWTPNEKMQLTVTALYQDDPEAGFRNFLERTGTLEPTNDGYIPTDFFVGDPDFHQSDRNQKSLGYDFRYTLNDTLTFRQNVSYNDIELSYKNLVWGALQSDGHTITRIASGGTETLDQQVMDNQLMMEFSQGHISHTLLVGLDYQQRERGYRWGFSFGGVPSIDWRNPVYGVGSFSLSDSRSATDTETRQTGIYIQDQLEIDRWNIAVGLRHDWAKTDIDDRLGGADENLDDTAFSGRLGVIYNLDNGLSPYASYTTSFEPVIESAPTGEPAFEPTTAKQWEMGIKYTPESGAFNGILSVYDIEQKDVLSWNSATFQYEQTGEIHSRGAELEVQADITPELRLIGSYNYIDAEVKDSKSATEIGKMPTRIPSEQLSLWADYQVASLGLGVSLGARYMGNSEGDSANRFQVPSVMLLDFSIKYNLATLSTVFQGAQLQLNASNLEDKRYTASCNSAFACFYGPRRMVKVALSYDF